MCVCLRLVLQFFFLIHVVVCFNSFSISFQNQKTKNPDASFSYDATVSSSSLVFLRKGWYQKRISRSTFDARHTHTHSRNGGHYRELRPAGTIKKKKNVVSFLKCTVWRGAVVEFLQTIEQQTIDRPRFSSKYNRVCILLLIVDLYIYIFL